MSSLLESVGVNNGIKIQAIESYKYIVRNQNSYFKHGLKPKNVFKSKCNKALKRKLKKYKLRKDGIEDKDVLDVSESLISSLKIKSPINTQKSAVNCAEIVELRPKNYLFQMARRNKSKPAVAAGELSNNYQQDVNEMLQTTESQDKKETNAFKLMMDSRNKSIGSNSPGKEISIDSVEIQEANEKKDLKIKRNLTLQKMAEAKGSLRKKQTEEHEEEFIKHKMEARAERLKKMMKNNKKRKKESLKHGKVDKQTNKPVKDIPDMAKMTKSDINNKTKQPKTLKLVDIFNDDIKCDKTNPAKTAKKLLLKEDEEFLHKLSPSLKKKENMLCYFKKIERKLDSPTDVEHNVPDDNDADIIKVKLTRKKKIKIKILSLNKNNSTDVLKDHNENNSSHYETKTLEQNFGESVCTSNSNDTRKRKREENTLRVNGDETKNIDSVDTKQGRPKRHVKKPIKYTNDAQLSSSDEELHIFTPKKRKHIEYNKHNNKTKPEIVHISDDESINVRKSNRKKNAVKEINIQKKTTKLAPIFAPKLTVEEIEAKQKFLHSGIPDKLKKIIAQQKTQNPEFSNCFHTVVHVQQTVETVTDTSITTLFEFPYNSDNENYENIGILDKEIFQNISLPTKVSSGNVLPLNVVKMHAVLQNIKETYPKFPVYRTYRSLKDKRRGIDYNCSALDNSVEIINTLAGIDAINNNPDSLTWTDKYKATSTNNLIGNFECIKELKKWLTTWTENKMRPATANSDSSDFYGSDTDSRDSVTATNNLLILTGPVGCGKTSCVYAVAAELSIKVIEVNASSKRTGKVMLQDLQEATQSHKVNRANGSAENSQKSQDALANVLPVNTKKKRRRPKLKSKNVITAEKSELLSQPHASQEVTGTRMSLILIDDADIVFDQDDGFCSAIAQLVQCSKRPVILITSSLSCSHLQRFLQCRRIMNMRPLLPKMLGTWLDIMCLADNGICWPGLGARFLDFFKGDIRKTINCLQFYLSTEPQQNTSEADTDSQNYDSCKSFNIEDESSRMSWADNESLDAKSVGTIEGVWTYFMGKETNLLLSYPLALFNIWWSVPNLLNETFNKPHESTKQSDNNEAKIKELDAIANLIDTFSVADCLHNINLDNRSNITCRPWSSYDSDSVSELENQDTFHRSHEINREILHELVTSSVINTQRTLHIDGNTEVCFPGMAAQRERDRIVTRHDQLTHFLNPSAILDRRALALDYWPSCRTICRVEKNRTDTVSRRHNRFHHYLKSLNVLCNNDSFDKLGNSLNFRGKDES